MTVQEEALRGIVECLRRRARRFALVGGLAVSVRAEVRFTRDIDIALVAETDADVERLVIELRAEGYSPIAVVEHDTAKRIATVRLMSPSGIVVDLLVASSGIESEIVERSTTIEFGSAGAIPVAGADELLAMKVLSMTDARLQDRIDATNLLSTGVVDRSRVVELLRLIRGRGYAREQDLEAKLSSLET